MKKITSLLLILLSFVLVGYRGTGRIGEDSQEEKTSLKSQTTLQSDVTVLIGDVYYKFAKGTACSINGTRSIGYGPEEYITVQGVSWWAPASVCN
jgi:hypothetical protein